MFLFALEFHKEKQNTETVSAILWSKYSHNKPKFCIVRDKNLEEECRPSIKSYEIQTNFCCCKRQNVSELGLQETCPKS